jgi:hypothetical protein
MEVNKKLTKTKYWISKKFGALFLNEVFLLKSY